MRAASGIGSFNRILTSLRLSCTACSSTLGARRIGRRIAFGHPRMVQPDSFFFEESIDFLNASVEFRKVLLSSGLLAEFEPAFFDLTDRGASPNFREVWEITKYYTRRGIESNDWRLELSPNLRMCKFDVVSTFGKIT